MFEEFSKYPKPKIKLFLKYLADAAGRMPHEPLHMPKIAEQGPREIEQRMVMITDERREELESKIRALFSKNKYLPLEERLKKIKKRYEWMKRSKKYSAKRLNKLKDRLNTCQQLLKRIEKLEAQGI
jgi:rubrerythrin